MLSKTDQLLKLQKFYKYQGTGNDFIMIDDRRNEFPQDRDLIGRLCDRKFGIGADGLILLQQKELFEMVYFNSDGRESSMCGNGGRCFARFLHDLGLMKDAVKFNAVDGMHYAEIVDEYVKLQMTDVEEVEIFDTHTFLNTGSPHHVILEQDLKNLDVKQRGAEIRYSEAYPEGTNVNFIHQLTPNRIEVRTYERGVEDETLSCGTGVTAAAITMAALGKTHENEVKIKTPGGNLKVSFVRNGNSFRKIFLTGPAEFVFKGEIKIQKT